MNAIYRRKFAYIFVIVVLNGCAFNGLPENRPVIPAAIEPSRAEWRYFSSRFRGDADYRCEKGRGAVKVYEWRLVAISADLFDSRGNRFGRMSELDLWAADDGSLARGVMTAELPALNAGAPSWRRYAVRIREGEKGVFANATSVVMTDTEGGIPVTLRCGPASTGVAQRFPVSGMLHFFAGR